MLINIRLLNTLNYSLLTKVRITELVRSVVVALTTNIDFEGLRVQRIVIGRVESGEIRARLTFLLSDLADIRKASGSKRKSRMS